MPRETGKSTNHETGLVVSGYEVVVINTENLIRVLLVHLEVIYLLVKLFIFLSSGCETRSKATFFSCVTIIR